MFKVKVWTLPLTTSMLFLGLSLSGCASYPKWLPSAGPSAVTVMDAQEYMDSSGIVVLQVTPELANRASLREVPPLFSTAFSSDTLPAHTVSRGDLLEVSIWEAPPATLFGGSSLGMSTGSAQGGTVSFPAQMISAEGYITIPFAGNIAVEGLTPPEIQSAIAHKLRNKANHPQVIVRIAQNATASVTIIGEVNSSQLVPLTAKGERLLDALAAAGGTSQSIGKTTLQISRHGVVESLPLETIISDPNQNIVLWPNDVVTALFKPFSFTVLGAAGKNEEVSFETQGISLAQALARAGGLQDNRADATGVFIFRFESPENIDLPTTQHSKATKDGQIPVIYQVNLRDPATFFVAQKFPMQNGDVMYVSNASGVELQKFLNMIFSGIYPTLTILNTVK